MTESTVVNECRTFVSDRLQVDLTALVKKKNALTARLHEYDTFLESLQLLRKSGVKTLATQVSLGAGVSIPAVVPDTQEIFVHVGLGCHVSCSYQEAVEKVALMKAVAESQLSDLLSRIGHVHAMMSFMHESIATLDETETESPKLYMRQVQCSESGKD